MSSDTTSYRVYKLKFELAMQDPDMPAPRFHHVIFVESNPTDGSGVKFHVTGDITSGSGMKYESTSDPNPASSDTNYTKELLGYTSAKNFKALWDATLTACPTPPQQKAFNVRTMKTEPFKTLNPLTFYEPGEERRPLRKCTEWTEEQAIPALRKAGLLLASPPRPGSSSSGAGSRPGSSYGKK
ncbi:hypothetical protein N658DRAFT_458665 [Parathielavia hyrcaniae]|uniref:Uncharacterized protein n=1 Tax=Parathielavia hyrcaniae TaxID=113614 RepID=A0AAN6SX07_9PEZI|nr:hypothetical protein N658DRAFT_458665 [Parathielavia hyrcaniae]